ncbi:GntR family transcriptional regulator [Chryseobacterium sp. 1B4]
MDSPIIKSLLNHITIDPASNRAVYLQLSDGILILIRQGKLKTGQKLPSSREIAKLFNINRITASKAFDELQMQGWLESFIGRGTFVSSHIPEPDPEKLQDIVSNKGIKTAGFELHENHYLPNPYFIPNSDLHLDDGYPDPKLAPLKELYRAYRNQLTRSGLYDKFGSYSFPDGSEFYKTTLSNHLNETRGLKTSLKNILSVRGTLMGINLVCTGLINPGDVVVSGIPGWQRAEHNFIHAKAQHIGIPVDEYGVCVDELKKICKKTKVRMVYVTPTIIIQLRYRSVLTEDLSC